MENLCATSTSSSSSSQTLGFISCSPCIPSVSSSVATGSPATTCPSLKFADSKTARNKRKPRKFVAKARPGSFVSGFSSDSFFGSTAGLHREASASQRAVHLVPEATASKERESTEQKGLDYASSGVDIDLEALAVKALITNLKGASVRKAGEKGALVPHSGGFSGLIEFGPDSLLAMCTDGVGSKLSLASALNHFETVGIDCMAMNVNDLLCVGAEPLAFVDYVAIPKPDPDVHAALGRSLAEACRQARVSLCGGETASLPGIVTELDLSGTALGWLPRGDQLTGERVSPGDVLIGIPSSGIHSNGYSLARKVLEKSGEDLRSVATFDTEGPFRNIHRFQSSQPGSPVTLGEVLLNPTRIYVDPIVDLLKACRDGSGPAPYQSLHAMAHITGGGLSNLLRLHPEHGYVIEDEIAVPPEFVWMQQVGNVTWREMYRTFNMGLGMVVVADATHGPQIAEWIAQRAPGSKIVGKVVSGGHKVTHALIPGVEYDHY